MYVAYILNIPMKLMIVIHLLMKSLCKQFNRKSVMIHVCVKIILLIYLKQVIWKTEDVEGNIKMDLRETSSEDVRWMGLSQGRV
jgi:hypothetical protein